MRQLISTIGIVILLISNSYSQGINYSIITIADSLLDNANAVIRDNNYHLVINNDSKTVLRVRKAITVINKNGMDMASLLISYDKFSKVKSIKGKVFDKYGMHIYTILKRDILDNSYFDGFSLYTDNRYKLIKAPNLKLPYTVEYEYEIEYDGIFQFPNWYPVSSYNVSTEHARLLILCPHNINLRTRNINNLPKCTKEIDNIYKYYQWDIDYFKAVVREPLNNSIFNIVPYLLIAPSNFNLEGYAGNTDTWKDLGRWISELNKGRDFLPDETKNKINSLVINVSDDKERAKIIYEYMQSKTRYVNISLGIGGLQPNKAEDTDRNGYGDCKALSLYTKALLDVVGINSNYAIVRAGKNARMIINDFPSLQFNHVTLCLPFEKDTIWLECTSQNLPFGYIGTFTDDRDALIINSNNNGKIVHTTTYPQSINTQNRNASFTIDEFGNVTGNVSTVFSGLQYENTNYLMTLTEVEQKKKLEKKLSIPNMKINNFSFDEKKNLIPSIKEDLEISIKNYATISSSRLFIVPNIFNKRKYIPKKISERKTDIVFRRGYIDSDTITFIIPKDYKIEYLPDNVFEKNKYETFSTSYILEKQKLTYIRSWSVNKGTFPPSDYDKIRNFMKLIHDADKETIVFIKEKKQ